VRAYWIACYHAIKNPDALAAYAKLAAPAIQAGGGRFLVRGMPAKTYEAGLTQRVVVIDYGPRIGIPVVNFSLGLYWDQHYHNRPFYTQREQWVSRAIQPSQPQRPAKAVAGATPQQQRAATTTTHSATTTTQQRTRTQQQISTAQQQQTQMPTKTARATAPKRPETTPPESQKPSQASQAEKRESAQAPTMVAKARSGEPKPKDELKKPPKSKDDKNDQGGNDGGH